MQVAAENASGCQVLQALLAATQGLRSALFYRLDRDPESGCLEDRFQAPQFWIACLRQHLVSGLARQSCFSRDAGDTTLRLGDLPKRKHERGLVALFDDGFQIGRRLGRVPQPPD